MILLKYLVFYTITVGGYQGENNFNQMTSKLTSNLNAPLMTVEDLKKVLNKKDVMILDAREPKEYSVSHITKAVPVGYKRFNLQQTLKKIPANQKVVVYCSVGYRSGKIVEKLRENGIEAYNLKGGVFGWVNSGNEVVDTNSKKTKRIHGYNKSWSKWIKAGEPVL